MQDTASQAAVQEPVAEALKLPEWVPEPIVEFWDLLDSYPLIGFGILILVSFLAAKLAQAIVRRGITRLTRKTKTEFDDKVVALLHRPVFILVFFTGLAVAIKDLAKDLAFSDELTRTVVNVLQTLIVLVWFRAGFPFFNLVLDGVSRLRDRFTLIEERTLPLFDILAKVILIAGASYMLLDVWDFDPTPWLASAGVLGIAIGFAAKDTLANLFGGFSILADAPYQIGDFIVLETGERGRVTNVGIRSTRLETRDDIEITIPNASIANAKIMNESGGKWEKERIRIKVGVAYGSDVDRVCEVLEQVAVGHEHVCPEPAARVRMRGFGDSSLDFELLCWIDEPVLRGRLSHELYMDVYKALNREKIEIPFPKRDVYLYQVPAAENGRKELPT
jgi:small-conductance mechanosensitive channel